MEGVSKKDKRKRLSENKAVNHNQRVFPQMKFTLAPPSPSKWLGLSHRVAPVRQYFQGFSSLLICFMPQVPWHLCFSASYKHSELSPWNGRTGKGFCLVLAFKLCSPAPREFPGVSWSSPVGKGYVIPNLTLTPHSPLSCLHQKSLLWVI